MIENTTIYKKKHVTDTAGSSAQNLTKLNWS